MATIYVKKDGSGNATTIQQGIQMAVAGDVVEIEAGTFDENVDLWKGITLKGAGKSQTIITGGNRSAITSKTFTWALGATTLTISSGNTDDYQVGRIVSATGIPANARIVSKTSTTLVISAATTQAATTARAVAMSLQNDATMRVRGGAGVIRDMKIVGFDHPNPATEYAAIYFRNTGLGTNFANGWEMFNCEVEANGEYALLTDSGVGLGNFDIHDCKFSGKTFVGANPASGNQFSVFNVPRQLVTVQGVNTGVNKFMNNEIVGVTGGLTTGGVASFNTAVTFDPANSIVSGNVLKGTFGYGYALRVRGAGSVVEDNTNFSLVGNTNSGFLIGPTGSQVIGMDVGTNNSITALMVASSQTAGSQLVNIAIEKTQLTSIPKLTESVEFSNESNWDLVISVFKHDSSAKRLVSASKDISISKNMKLKTGMKTGDKFELHKIIISKSDRSNLVMRRSEIPDASSYDFTLLNDGPVASGGENGGSSGSNSLTFELNSGFEIVSSDLTSFEKTSMNTAKAVDTESFGPMINSSFAGEISFSLDNLSSNYGSVVGLLSKSEGAVSLDDIQYSLPALRATITTSTIYLSWFSGYGFGTWNIPNSTSHVVKFVGTSDGTPSSFSKFKIFVDDIEIFEVTRSYVGDTMQTNNLYPYVLATESMLKLVQANKA